MTPILLIDDDPTTRMVLTRALEEQGYNVAVAKNGEEGIDMAKRLHPKLIICDWMMPGVDGLEVCRQTKAMKALSTTFFILLTARGAVEDRVMGLDTGADEFLAKPIDMDELKARVRAGLRIHQLSQDLQKQKQMLEAELSEAAGYVRSLLPVSRDHTAVRIEACFVPCQQLGGDCYDFQWLDEESLVMYLVDVSGHGVGAALLSISVLNILRSRSLPHTNFHDPSQVLEALNQAFQTSSSGSFYEEKYFTIWYGVYNTRRRTLTYASAGHPPALLLTNFGNPESAASLNRLNTPNLPIGMFPDIEYQAQHCTVTPSAKLYIFSDGVYEIPQSDGTVWGLDAFADWLTQTSHADDLASVFEHLQTLCDPHPFDDDVSLLQLRFS
ncbi:PP2C family protein-serine/threonine phosphatase [Sodalinema gerasimenkoae]|uniref:PP2C family protein-serine/threonine phosphatase n=1 Tax=Sodalinema gerasimenkoae TaxID=2862348 RepID=UPI001356F2DB|nr:SpoIIE family protein phosphatase [Sodalinema gerasimenkoae]